MQTESAPRQEALDESKPKSAVGVEFKRGTVSDASKIWGPEEDPFSASTSGNVSFPRTGENRGYRMLEEQEVPELLALHAKVWGQEAGAALESRWQWLQANPHADPGEKTVPLYARGGKIRAYQIAVPQRYLVQGKPWRVNLVGSLTGDPEARGGVVRLHNFMYDHYPVSSWGWVSEAFPLYQRVLGKNDYSQLEDKLPKPSPTGMPAEHASRSIFLHWEEPLPLVRPLRAEPYLGSPPLAALANGGLKLFDRVLSAGCRQYRAREMERFPQSLTPWLAATNASYPFILDRDVAYLNWRYVDFPSVRYRRFLFATKGADQPIGYAVIEEMTGPRGYPAWEIADLLTAPDRPSELSAVLCWLIHFARQGGASSLRARNPEHAARLQCYRRLGFRPRGEENRHIVYWRPPLSIAPEVLRDRANWPISWADADPRIV